jgi:hypothetical protein
VNADRYHLGLHWLHLLDPRKPLVFLLVPAALERFRGYRRFQLLDVDGRLLPYPASATRRQLCSLRPAEAVEGAVSPQEQGVIRELRRRAKAECYQCNFIARKLALRTTKFDQQKEKSACQS